MGYSRPLLERLEFPGDAGSRRIAADPREMMDSIRRHLQIMLNARHGDSSTVPDYGTTDFSDLLRGQQSLLALTEEITRSIQRYEPRLADIRVQFVETEDPFSLHFDIVAKVVDEEGETPAVFRTTIASSGEFRVTPL